jgi:two-component system response regulator HydG
MKLRILVIDDDASMCELIQESLGGGEWQVVTSCNGDEGLELASQQSFDVVITDVNLRSFSGLDLCRALTENRPDLPVILITAFGNMELAIAAMRARAHDFINKPVDMEELRAVIELAVRGRHRREQIRPLAEPPLAGDGPVGRLLGQSKGMLEVYRLIRRVATTETTVLLSGESGTGKELVASALHGDGARAQAPFIALNCAAVPCNLLESELFGHLQGSFTDASASRQGLFEQAGTGTLFLDEIGEMPLEMQPKLLRVLQERQVRPVGGGKLVSVRARVIAATNRDLEAEVAAGRFREDLYYRLNVVQIHLPPLRARGDDVAVLAAHFVEKFAKQMGKAVAGISPPALAKLLQYHWPGNIRQLENSMERAVALTRGNEITVEDLPDRVQHQAPLARLDQGQHPGIIATLDQRERWHIERVLAVVGGNKTEAAKLLGVNRRTLYRKLERYEGTPVTQGRAE